MFPYFALFLTPFVIMYFTKIFKSPTRSSSLQVKDYIECENLVHAQYAAGLIEDQIRKIREEDYPLREKYHELFGNTKEE